MFRFLTVAIFLANVAAFAPVGKSVRSSASSLKMFDVTKQIGAQMPLGYFDPLGLLKDADEETFKTWRTIETKHGRIAQMAVLGK